MTKEYTKEELWKLYKKLPEELKEAIFSETTADNIFNICVRNEIKDNQISEIARYAGRVLMGLVPPEEFQKTLEKELRLNTDLAKNVAREIFRFIFYPVKTSLEELYKTEINPPAGLPAVSPITRSSDRKPSSETIPEERLERDGKDVYREPIE